MSTARIPDPGVRTRLAMRLGQSVAVPATRHAGQRIA